MPPYQAVADAKADERREPPPGYGPELEEREKKKADDEESLNASITYEVIRREGEKELERSPQALAWSGLAAGLSMGFILVAEGVLRSHLPDAPWRPLIAKLGYSVGFLIVILGSQQLYTENTLTPIVPLLARRSVEMLGRVLRLWVIVLSTNLAATIVFAWVLARTTLFDPELHAAFIGVASEALRGDFATTFLRAIFAPPSSPTSSRAATRPGVITSGDSWPRRSSGTARRRNTRGDAQPRAGGWWQAVAPHLTSTSSSGHGPSDAPEASRRGIGPVDPGRSPRCSPAHARAVAYRE